jgi:hypothetical protein
VVYFAGSTAAPLTVLAAGKDWFSVFGKVSPLKRCNLHREDEKKGDILLATLGASAHFVLMRD